MKSFVKICQDAGLLIARIAFGGVLLLHGWQRWRTIGDQVAYLQQHNVPQPDLLAWGATILEALGGVLMIFGVLTPFVAAAFLIEFVIVIVWLKWPNGPVLENGGYEYSVALAALAIVFLVFGAGRAAVDSLFRGPRGEEKSKQHRPTTYSSSSTH